MQALIPRTVFPCYAAADRAIAANLAEFLERGADVRVFLDEGEMQPDQDLAAKTRDARVADIVLVLFSRESLPSRWPRAQWEAPMVTEPAEEDVRIAFVRCDDCVPPAVLKPRFEWSLEGKRQIKRWVRGHVPEAGRHTSDLELLGIAIADRPGLDTVDNSALALEFAREFRQDFDEVFRVECGGRSITALAGDLGIALGLSLSGPLEENLVRLREFCEPRRFLILLDDAWPDVVQPLVFGGRCSTLVASGECTPPESNELRLAQQALADPQVSWPEICRMARTGRRIARDAGRVAELFEMMQQWHGMAEDRGDRGVLDESARELIWILEGWGHTSEAMRLEGLRKTEYDDQIGLPFF